MGDTWITDMRHVLDVLEPEVDVPGPARRLAEYFGRIVEAATSKPPMQRVDTEIGCRRRPRRRPCIGHIRLVWDDEEGEITWECTSCGDRGVIRGFEGSPWDRSVDVPPGGGLDIYEPIPFEPVDTHGRGNFSRSGGPVEVVLDRAEYSVVRSVCQDQEIPSLILDNAEPRQDGFRMIATARNTEAFHDYLFDTAISDENPSHVQLLGQTVKKMRIALDAYLDDIF
jgi:hypothetical protein